ncbi:MAG: exosortase/archaeosortase family protein [Planctomycetales bacterium]
MASRRKKQSDSTPGGSAGSDSGSRAAQEGRNSSAPQKTPATVGLQSRAYAYAGALLASGLMAALYWKTIKELVETCGHEQDYTHGFLVPPVAILMAWMRRSTFPGWSKIPGWGGLLAIVAALAIRVLGQRLMLLPVEGWSLVLWIWGVCWLLLGFRGFLWAAPSLLFLLFMVPLPYRLERAMNWPLQNVTTTISEFMLQCLGQPAVAEVHRIYLGTSILDVEPTCSGLRMFMAISAIAFVFVVLSQRSWWERVLMILAVGPIAMISNGLRVTVTGLLMQTVSGESAATFSHDAAGWVMIVVAAVMFRLLVAYLGRLFIAVEVGQGRELLQGAAATSQG